MKRTPVGMSQPALWEFNDAVPSLASAKDHRDFDREGQDQDSLAERVASRRARPFPEREVGSGGGSENPLRSPYVRFWGGDGPECHPAPFRHHVGLGEGF